MTASDAGSAMPSAHARFSGSIIALHWLMAFLLVAVFALIEFRGIFPKGSEPREMMKALHFMLGLSVLALVVVRIGLRFAAATPAIVPAPSGWQSFLALGAHLALYGLMIALPLLGWLYLSAEGKNIPFFGLSLPPLVGQDHQLAETFEELHEVLGNVFYVVIALHVAAALAHHYLFRDNTLLRILPGRG